MVAMVTVVSCWYSYSRGTGTRTVRLVPPALRFRPMAAKEMIHSVMMEALKDRQYSSEHVPDWTKEISDSIKTRLKGKRRQRHLLFSDV